jgi:hypothetical protein
MFGRNLLQLPSSGHYPEIREQHVSPLLLSMCATLHDVSSQMTIVFVTEHPHKPIIERNALLNDREVTMAKGKNYTMRNFVIILKENTSYMQNFS